MLQRVYKCQLNITEVLMTNPVIFKDLPATFPEEDRHKKPAAIGSLAIHALVLTVLISVPLLIPERIEYRRLMMLVAPVPPPPPVAPPTTLVPSKPTMPEIRRIVQVDPGAVIAPTEIPKEIARIVNDAEIQPVGTAGGISNGSISGILHAVLLTDVKTPDTVLPAPPPPPPPPVVMTPSSPLRVGGAIKEPKPIKLVPPIYPKLAMKAGVGGTVVLEATVTAEGIVDEIKVISGNPLLTQAAIDCMRQWQYEPTFLNGEPVPVILTAKLNFELRPQS
jgi:periplasmic protein TonB